jgi:hypothetical protein
MNGHKPKDARVILRGKAAGGITAADILRRARELVALRGGKEDPTDEDMAEAERELLGSSDDPPTSTEDAGTPVAATRDPSEPVTDRGARVPITEEDDETTAAERLALQGVDEAQQDQMVEAQRKNRRDQT